jgi:Flp pilus assembly protein TadB
MEVRNTTFLRDAMRAAQPLRIQAAMKEAMRKAVSATKAGARAHAVIVDTLDDWPEPIRTTAIDVDADRIIVGEIIEP